MVSTFQFMTRLAAALSVANSSISSSANRSRQPGTMPSSVVPSWRPTSVAMASISSREAQRLGTGWPSPSLWLPDVVNDQPSAPASMALRSSAVMASICSGVASPPTDSGPITYRRIAQCPASQPAFTAMLPSNWSRYSLNVSHFQSTSWRAGRGMPSTRLIISWR